MKNFEICTVGHITLDKVVTRQNTQIMAGGTAYYLSRALGQLEVNASLVTAIAAPDTAILKEIRNRGIRVFNLPTRNTVYFENIYGEDMNRRDQNVLQVADPISPDQFPEVNARYYHLGALLASDIPLALIRSLHGKGKISMDIQGHLRHLVYQKVAYRDWHEKREALQYVSILKTNEFEMEVVTGTKDIYVGANYLADLGVEEVIVTLGDRGSVILSEGRFTQIPAFRPRQVTDTTGCGDSYMAGYLYKRARNGSIEEAGHFGSALASIKTEHFGPFSKDEAAIENTIASAEKTFAVLKELQFL